jgi:hypothetical protein
MTHHIPQKIISLTGTSPIVAAENNIPFGSQYLFIINPGTKTEFIGRSRSAVSFHYQWIKLS